MRRPQSAKNNTQQNKKQVQINQPDFSQTSNNFGQSQQTEEKDNSKKLPKEDNLKNNQKAFQSIDQDIQQAREELKKHRDQLFMKQLEYDVVKNMDMGRVNDMLLNKNIIVYDTAKRAYEEQSVEKRQQTININKYPDRQSRKAMMAQNYLVNKKDIYLKLKPIEIKGLTEIFDQKNRTMDASKIDDIEQLYNKYQHEYLEFLQRQPQIEYNRRILIRDLAETHEMLSCLKNVPSLDQPAFWNKKPLPEEEQKQIKGIVKDKIEEISNKYEFKQEEFDFENDKTDIVHEIKRYLDLQYFHKQI